MLTGFSQIPDAPLPGRVQLGTEGGSDHSSYRQPKEPTWKQEMLGEPGATSA